MKPPVPAKDMTQAQLARYIDSAILKPEFTEEDIKKYAQQGIDLGVDTICVNPCYLELLASMENTSIYPSLNFTVRNFRSISTMLSGLAKHDCEIFSKNSFSSSIFFIFPKNSPALSSVTTFNLCECSVVTI